MAIDIIAIDLNGQLWFSDGTADGTESAGFISGAYGGGIFAAGAPTFAVLNGELYFAGRSDSESFGPTGLWQSDGTGDGTTEITGINDANTVGNLLSGSADLISAFGKLLFDGDNNDGINSLWASNGSASGTSQVTGISEADATGLFYEISNPDFTLFDGSVLFEARDSSGAYGLWATSAAGATHEINISAADSNGIFAGSTVPDFAPIASGKLILAGTDASGDRNLWVMAGADSAPVELTGIADAAEQGLIGSSYDPPDFTAFGDGAVFQGETYEGSYIFEGQTYYEEADGLWFTNGTVKGTFPIPVPESPSTTPYNPDPIPSFAVLNGKLIFSADDSSEAESLWVLDSPTGTPEELTGIQGAPFSLDPTDLTTYGNYVYFFGEDSDHNVGLWRTNGTVLGTVEIEVLSTDSVPSDLDLAMSAVTINGPPPPSISSVTSTPASGTVLLGANVEIDLHMSEAVSVTGTPTLKLSDGGIASYTSSGSSNPADGVLQFDYTVASGQSSSDLEISTVILGGGASIKGVFGAAAKLTLTAADSDLHLVVNGIPPTVTGASVLPSSGMVSSGDTVTITLKLSEAVVVSGGGPVLEFNDGGSASFISAPTTSTLVFTYSVGSETTADLTIVGVENGGTVTDSAGNALSDVLSENLKLAVNTDDWKTGRSGLFGAGSNWTLSAPPTSSQEAGIGVAGVYTVSSINDETVAALGISDKTATFLVAGGTFADTSGTGGDANLGTITVVDGATLDIGGAFVNSGTLKASATSNGKAYVYDTGSALTNIGTTILSANDGGGASMSIDGGSVINSGTITVLAQDDASSASFGILNPVSAGDHLWLNDDYVNIDADGAYDSADADIYVTSVTNSGSFKVSAGGTSLAIAFLDVTSSLVNGGTMEATAGSESTAEINIIDSGGLTNSRDIEAIATARGTNVELQLFSGGALGNFGTINVSASGSGHAEADLTAGTVDNFGTLEASANGYGQATFGFTATVSSGTDVINSGTLIASASAGGSAALTFGGVSEGTNAGTVAALANGAHASSEIDIQFGGTVSNSGTTEAVAGAGAAAQVLLYFDTLDNTGGVLLASATGGGTASIELGYTTLTGGTLKSIGSAAMVEVDGEQGTVSSATIASNTNVECLDGGSLQLTDITLGADDTILAETGGAIVISGAVANSGTLGASGGGFLSVAAGTAAISNGKSAVIEALANSGSYAEVSIDGGNLINSGNVIASASGSGTALLYVNVSSIGNTGTMAASAATDGKATLAVSGQVNNSGGTLLATGSGIVEIDGANITGGTLRTSGAGAQITVFYPFDSATVSDMAVAAGSLVTASGALTFDTAAIGKSAMVEATGGTVYVSGFVSNSGTVFAADGGGVVDITSGSVVDGGVVEVGDGDVVLQSGGSTSAEIVFTSSGTGGLILDGTGSATYSALRISGFGGVSGTASEQFIDFTQVISGAGISAVYVSAASHTSGTLEVVSSGAIVAEVTLIGHYTTSDFKSGVGISGGVEITDPALGIVGGGIVTLATTSNGTPTTGGAAGVALLGNYMAALFATPEGQAGTPAIAAETAQSEAVLAHPHTG